MVLRAILFVVVKSRSYHFQGLCLSPMEKVIKLADGGWTVSLILCLTKNTF
jgi:hypothetical protein